MMMKTIKDEVGHDFITSLEYLQIKMEMLF